MKSLIFLSFLISSMAFSETYMVGDSIFAHRGGEVRRLIEADKSIAISSSAVTGARFWQIVKQFDDSRAGFGDTIIMDGGGNDIFGNSSVCRNTRTERCKYIIEDISRQFSSLLIRMRERGVGKIVFLTPYYTIGRIGSGYERAVDYGIDLFIPICSQAPIECSIVDARPLMKGPVYEWDGVHPNQNGTRILASAIASTL